MIRRLFTAHPAAVSETYGEHFGTASGFALKLFLASLACAIHAVLPFLFEKTGSHMINELHDRMVRNRARHAVADTAYAARQS
ncbi:DUF6356 family protein [Limibacillus halophilus]|uniref:Capsule biosynthesis protein n=1 Tax=Limibacillus halophilus TaxID=1579333 RepID=A0A839SQR7_9PROT|nr:DUF6356 family protein [Limibacillus halophilus]MBB3065237.1 hypothetical protein [Limibacillus halophilus]